MKKIILIILLVIFFSQLLFRIFSYRAEYLKPFDAQYWKMRYNQSQWVVLNSKNPIGDDGLFAYEGWEYVHGSNPVFLNPEIPPLGKYIIGAGELIFSNQNILILLIGLSSLGVFYILNILMFKNKLLGFIPVFLFSIDPLFYSQLRAPYLDTIYLLFLTLTLLFAVKRKYILMAIFLSCFSSIKYPVASIFLVAPILAWVLLFDPKNLKKFLLSLILWPTVFIFSYVMYFVHGGSIVGFLGIQKGIIYFYATGAKSPPGIIYPMILLGVWYTWFAGLQKVMEWTILWPVSFIATFFATVPLARALFKHRKSNIEDRNIILVLFWVLSYLVFLTFTPVFPRYLLLLLPFMYNLTIWFLVKYVFPRF